MIIGLDGTTAEYAQLDSDLLSELFSEIARADRRASHLFIIPRSIAAWAIDEVDLSARDAAQIKRIGQRYGQTGQFLSSPYPKIWVKPGASDWEETGKDVSVSPNFLVGSELLQPVGLIVEDQQADGELYKWLVSNFSKRRLGFPPVRVDPIHGGGGAIKRVVESKIKERNRLYAVVVDSDKDTPFCAQKPANKNLKKLCSSTHNQVAFFETPCREAENIIPISIIESVTNVACDENLSKIKENCKSETSSDNFLLYFDFKDGIDVDKFFLKHKDSNDKIEWLQKALPSSICSLTGYNINGFGDRIIEKFNESNEDKSSLYRHFGYKNWWFNTFSHWIESIALMFIVSAPNSRT